MALVHELGINAFDIWLQLLESCFKALTIAVMAEDSYPCLQLHTEIIS